MMFLITEKFMHCLVKGFEIFPRISGESRIPTYDCIMWTLYPVSEVFLCVLIDLDTEDESPLWNVNLEFIWCPLSLQCRDLDTQEQSWLLSGILVWGSCPMILYSWEPHYGEFMRCLVIPSYIWRVQDSDVWLCPILMRHPGRIISEPVFWRVQHNLVGGSGESKIPTYDCILSWCGVLVELYLIL